MNVPLADQCFSFFAGVSLHCINAHWLQEVWQLLNSRTFTPTSIGQQQVEAGFSALRAGFKIVAVRVQAGSSGRHMATLIFRKGRAASARADVANKRL
jgi:hypothetical protein